MLRATLRDHEPTLPDILVLPELVLPGPLAEEDEADGAVAAMLAGAIEVPGPEIEALIALAAEFQLTLVAGVAERAYDNEAAQGEPVFYNTVLMIDPEGVYGKYRKLHLSNSDRRWASPGNLGLPTFDTPAGRIGLATGYDVLFPETLRVLAGKGADLVCAPAYLNFPDPLGLPPSAIRFAVPAQPEEYDPYHYILWRVRADEHEVYLAVANWSGNVNGLRANGYSGIFSPSCPRYPWNEVIVDLEPEADDPTSPALAMMTIDTREQRTGRRSTSTLRYAPGEVEGSLTGELAYDIRDTIPGNAVRAKPLLRKRLPYWYLDIVKVNL
jgi:predicted amidohydrolase